MVLNCLIANSRGAGTFETIDAKLHIPVVTEDNEKLLRSLNLRFERAINWIKHQLEVVMQTKNQYLDYLVDLTFQKLTGCLFYHLKITRSEEDIQNAFFLKVETKG